MLEPEPSNYFEHIIRDADSYGAVLSEADLEISQIGPGCLSGRHVRFGLPGGQFSYVETSLALRGNGTFSNRWTLSVVLKSTTRSRQHGIEVRPGSLVIHRPEVEHDAVYSRNFKVACFSVRDEVLAKHFRHLDSQVQDAMRRPWSVFEPPLNSRQKTIEHFAEAAAIIRFAPQVRNSRPAVAKFEEELVCDFLAAVEQQFPPHPIETDQRAAAMVRQIDEDLRKSPVMSSSVSDLCAAYEVPRRTLNRASKTRSAWDRPPISGVSASMAPVVLCSGGVRARLRWPMLRSSSASGTSGVSPNNTMSCLLNCPMKPCAAQTEELEQRALEVRIMTTACLASTPAVALIDAASA